MKDWSYPIKVNLKPTKKLGYSNEDPAKLFMSRRHFQILHADRIGSVRYCDSCGHLRLEIGVVWAVVCPESLSPMIEDLRNREEHYFECLNEKDHPKKVLIEVNQSGMFLAFNPADLEALINLLEMSQYMLKVQSIINKTE